MAKESLLKKEFTSKDVNRARNLVKKDFSGKTVDGVGYAKAHVAYAEGDIWEESGRTWTIKDGIRQNITKLDAAKKAHTESGKENKANISAVEKNLILCK